MDEHSTTNSKIQVVGDMGDYCIFFSIYLNFKFFLIKCYKKHFLKSPMTLLFLAKHIQVEHPLYEIPTT